MHLPCLDWLVVSSCNCGIFQIKLLPTIMTLAMLRDREVVLENIKKDKSSAYDEAVVEDDVA